MAREYFNAYHSYRKAIEPLTDAEKGRLFAALLEYSETGAEPELRGSERYVYPLMKSQIDRDSEKYAIKCAVNRINGSHGGKANATERLRTLPNGGETDKTKEKTKEKTKDISPSISPPRFIPPTIDDVQTYCKERGNRIDAQRFVDFYSSKGWIVGKTKMKDWKASVRTWEKRDSQATTRKGQAGNHAMREYTDAEINSIGRSLLDE